MRITEISAAGRTACPVRSPWSERRLPRTPPTGGSPLGDGSRPRLLGCLRAAIVRNALAGTPPRPAIVVPVARTRLGPGSTFLLRPVSGAARARVPSRRSPGRPPARRRLVVATAYLTGTALLLPLAPSAIWLAAAAVVTEAAVPPTLVLLNVLTEKAVHPAALTQAFTWNNSASAAGLAVAAFLAGHVADAWGASAALPSVWVIRLGVRRIRGVARRAGRSARG
jgi:hypothetical protein